MMYECWSQPHFQRILQSLLLVLCFLASPTLSRIEKLPSCWEPCASSYSGVEVVPGTDCTIYQTCHNGVAKNRVKCGDGLLYNAKAKYCDYYWNVECEVETQCPPTLSPTESPTFTPTESPTSVSISRIERTMYCLVLLWIVSPTTRFFFIDKSFQRDQQKRQRNLQLRNQLYLP